MTRAICIMGSPRPGGNSDVAATRVCEGLRDAMDIELVRLREIELERCRGCRQCMRLGRCAIETDAFPELWQKLLRAHVLFQVLPVYWNAPPGLMKDFIDRTHTAYAGTGHMAGTLAYTVSVATLSGFETADAIAESWFVSYGGTVAGRAHLLACEKGDLRDRPRELAKLDRLIQDARAIAPS